MVGPSNAGDDTLGGGDARLKEYFLGAIASLCHVMWEAAHAIGQHRSATQKRQRRARHRNPSAWGGFTFSSASISDLSRFIL